MERQKPHLGLTWQKRPSPPGAEWSSSSCQEDRQVRGERADDALPPPASAARPRPLQTCHGDAQRSLSLSPPLPGPHSPLCSLSLFLATERSSSPPTPSTAATSPPPPNGCALVLRLDACIVLAEPCNPGRIESPPSTSSSTPAVRDRRQRPIAVRLPASPRSTPVDPP